MTRLPSHNLLLNVSPDDLHSHPNRSSAWRSSYSRRAPSFWHDGLTLVCRARRALFLPKPRARATSLNPMAFVGRDLRRLLPAMGKLALREPPRGFRVCWLAQRAAGTFFKTRRLRLAAMVSLRRVGSTLPATAGLGNCASPGILATRYQLPGYARRDCTKPLPILLRGWGVRHERNRRRFNVQEVGQVAQGPQNVCHG